MLIDRHAMKVLKAASTDPQRGPLQGLHVKGGHLEATNGHILARVALPSFPVEEFPAGWGVVGEMPEGTILDAADLKEVDRGLQKTKGTLPILSVASIGRNGEGFKGYNTARWGLDGQTYTVKDIEGSYPDLDTVNPEGKPTLQVAINATYLRMIADLAEKGEMVVFTFHQKKGEMQYLQAVEFETKADRPIKGLVMPMRF